MSANVVTIGSSTCGAMPLLVADAAAHRLGLGMHAVLVHDHVVAELAPGGQLGGGQRLAVAKHHAEIRLDHPACHQIVVQRDRHAIRNAAVQHRTHALERSHRLHVAHHSQA